MHTPGPWAEDENHTGGARVIIGDGQQLVALVYGETPEARDANAKLIVAALDLLAASETFKFAQGLSGLSEAHRMAFAAVAKAKTP